MPYILHVFLLIIIQALLDRFLVFTSVLEEHALMAVVDSLVGCLILF
jgi:hypothetical protein